MVACYGVSLVLYRSKSYVNSRNTMDKNLMAFACLLVEVLKLGSFGMALHQSKSHLSTLGAETVPNIVS